MKRFLVIVAVWALFTAAWLVAVWAFDLSPLWSFFGGIPVGAFGVAAGQLCADEWVGYR